MPADQQANYTINFATDGTFSARADCNTVNGGYTVTSSGGLTLTPGPTTTVACAEGSYSDLYIIGLTSARELRRGEQPAHDHAGRRGDARLPEQRHLSDASNRPGPSDWGPGLSMSRRAVPAALRAAATRSPAGPRVTGFGTRPMPAHEVQRLLPAARSIDPSAPPVRAFFQVAMVASRIWRWSAGSLARSGTAAKVASRPFCGSAVISVHRPQRGGGEGLERLRLGLERLRAGHEARARAAARRRPR